MHGLGPTPQRWRKRWRMWPQQQQQKTLQHCFSCRYACRDSDHYDLKVGCNVKFEETVGRTHLNEPLEATSSWTIIGEETYEWCSRPAGCFTISCAKTVQLFLGKTTRITQAPTAFLGGEDSKWRLNYLKWGQKKTDKVIYWAFIKQWVIFVF